MYSINPTLHFSLVLLHHFTAFKSLLPSSSSILCLFLSGNFSPFLPSCRLPAHPLRATLYYLSYVNEFRLIIWEVTRERVRAKGWGSWGTSRGKRWEHDIASVTVKDYPPEFAATLPALEFLNPIHPFPRLPPFQSSSSYVVPFIPRK